MTNKMVVEKKSKLAAIFKMDQIKKFSDFNKIWYLGVVFHDSKLW